MMRRLMYISHIALGFSGALCFLVITAILLYKMPVVNSLLAHADAAANNAVTATGVVARSSAEQARQAVTIERDIRALTWHINRSLGSADRLMGAGTDVLRTVNFQASHIGPLLDSLRDASNSVPASLSHLSSTEDAATKTLASVQDDADAIRDRVSDKRVDELIDRLNGTAKHVQGMSESGDTILKNGARVSTKLADDFTKPVPWWKWPIKKMGDIFDIGAWAAQHSP